jgi:hypothetical protein
MTMRRLAPDPDGRRRRQRCQGAPEEWNDKVGGRDYKVHLDGYNQMDMLTGKGKSKRHEFFFYGENDFNAFRVDQWKIHLHAQELHGSVRTRASSMAA